MGFTDNACCNTGEAGQSKDGGRTLYDGQNKQGKKQTARLASVNTSLVAYGASANFSSGMAFKRNMSEHKVKVQLFMMEGEAGFEELTIRSKMTEVAARGDNNLREWFYEAGVSGELPETWEEFKTRLVEFCVGTGIDALRKYKDEKWSSYILRLKEWCAFRSHEEGIVFKKLRREIAPERYQMLFFAPNMSLDDLLMRLRDWESLDRQGGVGKERCGGTGDQSGVRAEKYEKNWMERATCYRCGEVGHVKAYCPVSTRGGERVAASAHNVSYSEHALDEREVRLNDMNYLAIFDTGATHSMIGKRLLGRMGKIVIERLGNAKKFSMINGGHIEVVRTVTLSVIYEGKRRLEKFFIIEDERCHKVIIGNKLVKELAGEEEEGANTGMFEIPVECTIPTEEGAMVSWSRPIRSKKEREEFRELVDDLQRRRIVEPSQSLWLNPVVLRRKKNGELRFCVDLRRINDLVPLDGYSQPKITELIAELRGHKWFSTLDLKDGYFQVPIRKEDREKTTFDDGSGRLMQFTRMPQGYKNSSGIFQRVMNIVLQGLIGKSCLVYLDDILIFGRSVEEHNCNLRQVRERLDKYCLEENHEKSVIFKKEVIFLGYRVRENTVRPTTDRAQGIIEYPAPGNKKQVQRFLGLINYDRPFIEKASEKLQFLYDLTQKDMPFTWNQESESRFAEVKELWRQNLELVVPDWDKNFVLESDASNVGLGAVLKQDGKTIAYVSRTLKKAERNYSITEKEVLAALWAMEKLRYYLDGREFDLVSDHEAIKEMRKKLEFGSAKIARWFERLEAFNYRPIYRKGAEMVQADALSRAPGVEDVSGKLGKIMEVHEELSHRKGILKELEERGIEATREELGEVIEECGVCKRKDKKYGGGVNFVVTSEPGERVGMDLMEVSKSERVVLAIDYFTRKIYGKVINTKESGKVLSFIREVQKELKIKTLLTDNGREFDNTRMKAWASETDVKLEFAVPYYHDSNGRVERANRTIRDALKKTAGPLKLRLRNAVKAYNDCRHRGIGMSPDEAMMKSNWEKVREHQARYSQEIMKNKGFEKFEIGQKVLIRNELKKGKMDDEFKDQGIIVECLEHDVYKIRLGKGKGLRRHSLQLRRA